MKKERKEGRNLNPVVGEKRINSGEHAQDQGDKGRCPSKMELVEARGLGCLQHRWIFK